MHDNLFAASCRPVGGTCLLLTLKPYTLGHEIELWRQNNPIPILSREEFDALPEQTARAALVEAADICSQSWGEFHESAATLAATPRWFQFAARRKQRRLRAVWRNWKSALAKFEAMDWAISLAEFRNYLWEGRSIMPTISSDDQDDVIAYTMAGSGDKLEQGRPIGTPLSAQLLDFVLSSGLHRDLGLASPFDVPFSMCANLFLARLEQKGSIYVLNAREHQVKLEMAEHRKHVDQEEDEQCPAQTQL